jgi:endonuclease/exonuclease/phosphatase family metal-dependent hydrolase
MRKAAKAAGIISTVLIVCLYIVSLLTAYISPLDLPFLSVIAILYLPVVLCYVLVMITWFFFRKKIFLLLFLLFFAGYKNFFSNIGLNVCVGAWKPVKQAGSIRVMNWNVNRLGNPYEGKLGLKEADKNILELIRKSKPDILCIQDLADIEDLDKQNTFIQNTRIVLEAGNFSSCFYSFFYEYRTATDSGRLGVAIFSKYPFIDTGSVLTGGYITKERAAYVDVLINSKPLRIFTAHFSSMSLWPNTREGAGMKYLDGDSKAAKAKNIYSRIKSFGEIHVKEAEVIKRFVNRSPYPFIFTADLNSVPSGYVYHYLKKGLGDAFLEKDFGIGGTYNRVFPKLRIDVLFYSKDLEAVQFIRPAPDLSDHYPLIADIKWKE